MNSRRAVAQLLKHLAGTGMTHIPHVEFQRSAASAKGEETRRGRKPAKPESVAESRPTPSRVEAVETDASRIRAPERNTAVAELITQKPASPEQKVAALCALKDVVAACRRCPDLASRRKQTVFGVGSATARIMFIGEAPGAEEDAQGEPFVGAAGQLLNKIIQASTLRREDLYICNILRCRPPGNRNPLPQEAANCREFLDAQIQIVQPEYIICWGTVAAQNLLGVEDAVGRLRGRFFEHGRAKVLCTYHPSYLLRNPSAKKLVWDDMKLFMKEFGVELQ